MPGAQRGRGWRSMATVKREYEDALRLRGLRREEAQERIIVKLDKIHARLRRYGVARMAQYEAQQAQKAKAVAQEANVEAGEAEGSEAQTATIEEELKQSEAKQAEAKLRSPRGLYISGSVGTGKSLCMDIFFSACKDWH